MDVKELRLPICFVWSRAVKSSYHQLNFGLVRNLNISLAVGKTNWNILTHWCNQKRLKLVEITRTCNDSLKELNIEITLFVKRSGIIRWEYTDSTLFSEDQATCSFYPSTLYGVFTFESSDILEGELTIRDPELFSPLTNQDSSSTSDTEPQLSVDFLRILENKDTFADVKLKCGTTDFPVHKCILSARSPVFDAMFKNKMKESEHGVVVIEDLKPEVLQTMLKYVYSGKTDHLTDTLADDLLFAADKYQLKELKSICIDKLKKATTVNNVVRVLVLGHLHDENLKEHAKTVVCSFKKITELENTEGWKSLVEENPALANEVLMAVVKKLQNC